MSQMALLYLWTFGLRFTSSKWEQAAWDTEVLLLLHPTITGAFSDCGY